MAAKTLSKEDQDFLAQCDEEFKDRFTENDEDFMKVFNAEPSKPPILENWWNPNNSGRRNDRRHNRRHHPYERQGNRDNRFQGRQQNYDSRGYYDRRDNYEPSSYNERRDNTEHRGYNEYQGFDDRQRRRY